MMTLVSSLKRAALGLVIAAGVALAPAQAAPTPPDQVVKTATDTLQQKISANHKQYEADKNAFYKMVDDTILTYFDTPYIAQLILARNWKDASDDQKKRFEVAFKNMLIRSYADALLQYYDSVKAEVKPVQAAAGSDKVTVNVAVLRKDGPPLPLAFDMRLKQGTEQWKIFDIKVENISLVTNFRGQVTAQIKQSSLEDVIKKLESGQQVVAPPDATKS